MHSSPYSTANKSLSSDTIQEKVCSRSSAQTLSVFGPNLFWSSPFQSLDVWHERIDMPVAQTVMKTVMFFAALMVWIIIKLIWNFVSAPFWHFIHRCLLSPLRNVSTQLFTLHTYSLIVHCDLLSRNIERKVTLHILSSDHLWRGIRVDACSPGYMCPPQRATH